MKEQAHNRLLNDNINSKRVLNDDNKNQNEENIYNRNINQLLQGPETKEENKDSKRDNNGNNNGDKDKNCCDKMGCLIF